jgi:hypothetical protein
MADRKDVVQLVGLYFLTHLTARLQLTPTRQAENARCKLNAASIAQCVAKALQRDLLS